MVEFVEERSIVPIEEVEAPPRMLPGLSGLPSVGGVPVTGLVQTHSQHAVARRVDVPRALPLVQSRLLQEADLACEAFYYGWGSGKDYIEGPSVRLALAAARCYGNCSVEVELSAETPESWVFHAHFIDLETGFTLVRPFRQSKRWKVYGRHDAERKDDIRFQIGASKALRNVVLNAIPDGLIDAAIERAKSGLRKKVVVKVANVGLEAAYARTLEALAQLGVTTPAVCDLFGVAKADALWSGDGELAVDRLTILTANLRALKRGDEEPHTLFPALGGAGTIQRVQNPLDALASGVPPAGAAPAPELFPSPEEGSKKRQQKPPAAPDGPNPFEG